MEQTGLRLTQPQIDSLDEMVERGYYPSRSEALRAAVSMLQEKFGIYSKTKKEAACHSA